VVVMAAAAAVAVATAVAVVGVVVVAVAVTAAGSSSSRTVRGFVCFTHYTGKYVISSATHLHHLKHLSAQYTILK